MPRLIEIAKNPINYLKLEEDIIAAINTKYEGMKHGNGIVTCRINDSTSTSEETTVRNIIIDHDYTQLSSSQIEEQNIQTSVQATLANAALARQYPQEITGILNACVENLGLNQTLDDLFNAVKTAVDNSPGAVKNRFDRRCSRVKGIDPLLITLDTQKQAYVDSAHTLANSLIALLIISDTMN